MQLLALLLAAASCHAYVITGPRPALTFAGSLASRSSSPASRASPLVDRVSITAWRRPTSSFQQSRAGARGREARGSGTLMMGASTEAAEGITYAKRGMGVDVKMNDEWLPAVVVDMSEKGSVVVQYVGGDERCREEVSMTSGRIRIGQGGAVGSADEAGSGITGAGQGGGDGGGGARAQLEWAAKFASAAAGGSGSDGRTWSKRSVVVPLVSSLEGVGWRERRQSSEGWYCSWTPNAGPRRNGGQLPSNLVGYTSLQTLLDALDGVEGAGIAARQAVTAMNHIKRLQWQCKDDEALNARMKESMRRFAHVANEGMGSLGPKDVALVLNAVSTVLDARTECPGLSSADGTVVATTPPPGYDPSAASSGGGCVFWGMFDGASLRIQKLHNLYLSHARLGVSPLENPGRFASQSIGMIANAFASAGIRDDRLLGILSDSITKQPRDSRDVSARSLSMLASSFARLKAGSPALFSRIAYLSRGVPMKQWDGGSLPPLACALERAGVLTPELAIYFGRVASSASPKKFTANDAARLLPPLVAAGGEGGLVRFFASFSRCLEGANVRSVPPSAVASLAEEFVKGAEKGHCTAEERDRILDSASLLTAELAPVCPHAFSGGAAASLLAAFARSQKFDAGVFGAVGGVVQFLEGNGRGRMTTSEAASCLNAMAQAVEGGHASHASLPLAAMGRIASTSLRECAASPGGCNARAAADIASSAARLRLRCPHLLASLSSIVADKRAGERLSTDIMFSLASLGWRDDDAVAAWGELLEGAAVAVAVAVGGEDRPEARDSRHKRRGGEEQEAPPLSKVCWTAAALGGCGEGVHAWVRRAADEAEAKSSQGYEIPSEDAVRVHQYMIEYDVGTLGGEGGEFWGGVAWEGKRGLTQVGAMSITQAQVAASVKSMGLPTSEEWVEPRTGYTVDLRVALAGDCVVLVEVDGPVHYDSVEGREVLGGTQMKRRHLRERGYSVVSVPFWEWDAMNRGNKGEQDRMRAQYLANAMAAASS